MTEDPRRAARPESPHIQGTVNGMLNERYLTSEGARAYAAKYEGSVLRRLSARREAACVRRALELAGAQPGGVRRTILDMPCGAGRFTKLVERLADRVINADISMPMLEVSSARAGGSGQGALIRVAADAAALPFRSRSVDGTLTMRLLHHLREPTTRRAVLAEIARVADRFLIVSFLDASSIKQRWLRLRTHLGRRPPRRTAITRAALAADLAAFDFEIVGFLAISSFFSGQTITFCRRKT